MLQTLAGVEPATSWSPVGRHIQLSHRGPNSLSNTCTCKRRIVWHTCTLMKLMQQCDRIWPKQPEQVLILDLTIVNVLKFPTLYSIHFWHELILLFMHLFLEVVSGMVNSVDPDQTAPDGAVWSGSTLFAYAILLETLLCTILEHLPYSKFFVRPYPLLQALLSHIKMKGDNKRLCAKKHCPVMSWILPLAWFEPGIPGTWDLQLEALTILALICFNNMVGCKNWRSDHLSHNARQSTYWHIFDPISYIHVLCIRIFLLYYGFLCRA